jgi:hypothetical protein
MYKYFNVHIHMYIPVKLSLLMTKTSKSTSSESDIRPVWTLKRFLFVLISVILKMEPIVNLLCSLIVIVNVFLAKEIIHIQIFEHM